MKLTENLVIENLLQWRKVQRPNSIDSFSLSIFDNLEFELRFDEAAKPN